VSVKWVLIFAVHIARFVRQVVNREIQRAVLTPDCPLKSSGKTGSRLYPLTDCSIEGLTDLVCNVVRPCKFENHDIQLYYSQNHVISRKRKYVLNIN
jgi:hypothetical protein